MLDEGTRQANAEREEHIARNRLTSRRDELRATCGICVHHDRAAIEAKMREGLPLGVIIERFYLEPGSARRHRDEHLRFGRVTAPPPEPESGQDWDAIFGEMAAALEGLR
jgi:hypothetical protein